jgi:hypothetical protein
MRWLLCRSASLSVGIIFMSYAVHTRFHPFMDSLDVDSSTVEGAGVLAKGLEGAVVNYVSARHES